MKKTPRLMTATELKDLYERMADTDVDRLEAHLLALSSVPEDVAQTVQRLRLILIENGLEKELPGTAQELVTRLATAAARVSGLEAACAEYERTINEDIDGKLALRRELGATDSETYPAFVRRLASERDAARQEVATLQEEVDAWKENCGLVGSSGDPDNVRPAHLSADLQKRDAEYERLAARVEELEAEKAEALESFKAADAECDRMRRTRDMWKGKAESAEARATTAEARAATLEAQLRSAQERANFYAKQLDGQPTPAPGLRKAVGRALCVLACWDASARRYVKKHEPECECGACGLLAAYDAAPEPSVTHADLAAVVDALKPNAYRNEGSPYADGYLDALDEALRRATGGQVPESLPKARVVAVLATVVTRARAAASNTHEAGDPLREALANLYTGEANGATEAAEMLGLTLPTGPSGGETVPTPVQGFSTTGMSGWTVSNPARSPDEPTQRARIPEPSHVEPVTLGKGPFQMLPDVAARAVERTHRTVTDAQPEPAAPEVADNGEEPLLDLAAEDSGRVWVMPNGEWGHEGGSLTWALDALARALSEAKRENADLKTEVELKQTALDGQSRDYRDARKAAEAMRERAAKALLARRDQMAGRTMESGRRRGLEEGAAIVRALPWSALE